MAIRFACQHCGERFTAKDEQAGKRAKCSACGEVTRIPSQPTWEADDSPTPPTVSPEAPPADGKKRRPLWKDPVVVIGMAAPTLILAVFFTSLAWLHFRSNRTGAGAQGVVRDPNIKNHYSKNNYKKMRQMSEQARDKNA